MRKIIVLLAISALVLYLVSNIIASQVPASLFSRLASGDKAAQVYFFKRVKSLPQFVKIYPEIKESYLSLENEILTDDRRRWQSIKNLEEILKKNPQARDVLYILSLLYKRQGDTVKSIEYLQRAKVVDPDVEKRVIIESY